MYTFIGDDEDFIIIVDESGWLARLADSEASFRFDWVERSGPIELASPLTID